MNNPYTARILKLELTQGVQHEAQYRRSLTAAQQDDSFLTLETAPSEEVKLPTANGQSWADPVDTFVLEVEFELPRDPKRIYIVAGHLDRKLPDESNLMDDRVLFTINSIWEARDFSNLSKPYANAPRLLTSGYQVLVDHHYSGFDGTETHRARPYEMMCSLARQDDPPLMKQGVTFTDLRSLHTANMVFSEYARIDPRFVEQEIIDAFNESKDAPEGKPCLWRHLAVKMRDVAPQGNIFLKSIPNTREGSAYFSFKDLQELDPDVQHSITWKAVRRPNFDTQYEHWGEASPDNQHSTLLVNSVLAMMAMHGIRSCYLYMQNELSISSIEVQDAEGIANPTDEEGECAFKSRVLARFIELMKGAGLTGKIKGRFDLFGNSDFKISLHGIEKSYFHPTWGNALFSPMIVPNMQSLDGIAANVGARWLESANAVDQDQDHHLSAEQLDEKYNPDGDGQHPKIPRSMWRAAVEHQETINGYWVWVRHKLIEEAESN